MVSHPLPFHFWWQTPFQFLFSVWEQFAGWFCVKKNAINSSKKGQVCKSPSMTSCVQKLNSIIFITRLHALRNTHVRSIFSAISIQMNLIRILTVRNFILWMNRMVHRSTLFYHDVHIPFFIHQCINGLVDYSHNIFIGLYLIGLLHWNERHSESVMYNDFNKCLHGVGSGLLA